MWNQLDSGRKVTQRLHWAEIDEQRASLADTMYANSGRRLYVIGDIDGRFRPRSNPYDLYAFGHPQPDDPLANKLQGVWAQPVRGFAGFGWQVDVDGQLAPLEDAVTFTQTYATAEFDFALPGLLAHRVDCVPLDAPVLLTRLTLQNVGSETRSLPLTFWAAFDLQDAWFTQLAERRNDGQALQAAENYLSACANVLPEQWAALALSAWKPGVTRLVDETRGEMDFPLVLRAGEEVTLTLALAVVSEGGIPQALTVAQDALRQADALMAEKVQAYSSIWANGPRLISPDERLNRAFRLAQANLEMLEAQTRDMGRYFYAGLEMFPFWFSNDGAYSTAGMVAAGFAESAKNHTALGMRYQGEGGSILHQISPSGKPAFAGNAQETPLWVIAVWDVYRWTGDRGFLSQMYPAVLKGIFDYTLGVIDPDGDGYPSGAGMVEAEGMGEEKLDSAAYTWAALKAAAQIAVLLGDEASQLRAQGYIEKIEASFDADWWDESSGAYAMSLDQNNQRYQVPHWAVIVPLEVGLATPDHAAATFVTLRATYLNQWGLKHTAGEDERVWTLPTATLSRAAFRYGEPDLGYAMLRHIASTLEQGSIGVFHELIPEGACFLQLWSGATLLRGVIEDLIGVEVRADQPEMQVHPHLPQGWASARLENLRVGSQTWNVEVRVDKSYTLEKVNFGS